MQIAGINASGTMFTKSPQAVQKLPGLLNVARENEENTAQHNKRRENGQCRSAHRRCGSRMRPMRQPACSAAASIRLNAPVASTASTPDAAYNRQFPIRYNC